MSNLLRASIFEMLVSKGDLQEAIEESRRVVRGVAKGAKFVETLLDESLKKTKPGTRVHTACMFGALGSSYVKSTAEAMLGKKR
jgi:hypothetical protein